MRRACDCLPWAGRNLAGNLISPYGVSKVAFMNHGSDFYRIKVLSLCFPNPNTMFVNRVWGLIDRLQQGNAFYA